MKITFYKYLESIYNFETAPFLFGTFIFLIILVLVRNEFQAQKTNEIFENCQLKIAKITDNIGNFHFKIVISENNGADFLEFQEYLNAKSYSLGPLFSYSHKEFKSICSSFDTLEDAVNELYNFKDRFGQSSFENKVELQ
ncbi:hypothetical protein K6T82_23850 [Flavobacterium sp. 17A]|uniref:Uncharacterized protein n=1 Tax=Flavobacterium potami TaxID=2872310 RepID=A0A9X1HHF4_9FLAO|nr:hypothetical protein [Flavobacterium potami]MBZ4037812.1 hypothetical protein [Flavobacterium potami]